MVANANQSIRYSQQTLDEALSTPVPDHWLAACAHELRNPIAQIEAAVMVLAADAETGYLTPAERQQYLHDIAAANQSLNVLVEDCIAFAKSQQSDFPARLQQVDLYTLLTQLHHSFLAQMYPGIQLLFEYEATVPHYVLGDPQRISQCVANLLRNAIKFTEKGSIVLRVSTYSPTHLRITVQDTGIGVPSEKIHTIWQVFTKAHDTVADQSMGRHKGLGLGLAIMSRFVKQMQGQVGVESVVGEGSTFYFTLPIGVEDSSSYHELA